MLMGFSPTLSVFWATVTAFAVSFFKRETALYPRRFVKAMETGTTGVLNVAATCASAGIIVGVVTLTGLGLKFSSIVIEYAGGSLALTAVYTAAIVWIVGLAVPVTASYIICAVIAAPALITLGVPDFAAHMFIFYYALLSEVSPPTALSCFAAAAITGADPYKTTLQAWKYTMPAFVVPFFFVLDPMGTGVLLQLPKGATWMEVAWVVFLIFVAIAALAAGLQGWLLKKTNLLERALLVVAGALVIIPVASLDAVGVGMFASVFVIQMLRHRRAAVAHMTERFAPAPLLDLMRRALERSGATPAMAAATAAALVAAELDGIPSHGASRIPQYCGHVKNGRATGSAVPQVVRERGGACLVDAGGGLAFEACALAVREAIARAKTNGVAFASVTNSNHFGVAAYHAEPIAEAGLVGLAFGNSPAAMPMWGGKRALFGTNPIAAAFPRRDAPPIVVDLSLSEVARGKLMVAAREGKPIPARLGARQGRQPHHRPQGRARGHDAARPAAPRARCSRSPSSCSPARSPAPPSASSPTASSPTRASPRASGRPSSRSTPTRSPAARCSSSASRRWSPRCSRTPACACRATGGAPTASGSRREGIAIAPDLAAKIRALAGEG